MDSFDDGCFYYIKLLLMIGNYMNIQFKIYIYIYNYLLFISMNICIYRHLIRMSKNYFTFCLVSYLQTQCCYCSILLILFFLYRNFSIFLFHFNNILHNAFFRNTFY